MSGKKSALKRKSEKVQIEIQTESNKKKIHGTKSMEQAISEGHNFINTTWNQST